MTTSLDDLRSLLTDIPAASGFNESVRLVREAFDARSPLSVFQRHDLEDFHGAELLARLFGEFARVIPGTSMGQLAPGKGLPLGARRKVQSFAVLGCSPSSPENGVPSSQKVARSLILQGSALDQFSDRSQADARLLPHLELLALRESLMNRRQATLLAAHLNRFRRNGKHNEVLDWYVVKGPDRWGNVREWLDAFSPDAPLLRRCLGELELAGLDSTSCSHLSLYHFAHGRRVQEGQCVAIESPLRRLAPRYLVTAKAPRSVDCLPPGATLECWRANNCESTLAHVSLLEKAGLLRGGSAYDLAQDPMSDGHGTIAEQGESFSRRLAGSLWGLPDEGNDDGFPGSLMSGDSQADRYSRAFTKIEALKALQHLKFLGYTRVRARQVGSDGIYGTAPYWFYPLSKYSPSACVYEQEIHLPGTAPLRLLVTATFYVDRLAEPDKLSAWERALIERVERAERAKADR